MKMRQSCNSWWGGVGGAGREKTSSGITKPERVKGEKDSYNGDGGHRRCWFRSPPYNGFVVLPSRAAAGSANAMTQLLTTVYFSDLDRFHSNAKEIGFIKGLHAFMPEPAQEEIFSLWEQVVVACMKIKEKLVEGENKIKCKMRTLIGFFLLEKGEVNGSMKKVVILKIPFILMIGSTTMSSTEALKAGLCEKALIGMEYVLHGVIALGIMAAGGVLSGGNPASHVLQIKKQGDSADAKLVVTL
ncbi:hypothetical protein Ahy_B04g071850 isoform F [Arachis hypogaea]|uniref:Uncharacterized protein n=1 Tax=Arachis hypogaea TaxID=3818 RepID=A0A444ZLU0_ARAHY|nr:hypothetical protein Ahy_B04g071850 isoform F [Arachis hypogaea]